MSWSIPTDNLYKFSATVGVVLCLLALIAPIYVARTTYLDTINDDSSRWKDSLRLERNKTQVVIVTHVIDSIKQLRFDKIIWTKNEKGIYIADSMNFPVYKWWYDEHRRLMDEHLEIYDRIEKAEMKLMDRDFLNIVLNKCSLVAILIGYLLTCFGFFRWFNNVQVYQDLKSEKEGGFDIIHQADYYSKLAERKIKRFTYYIIVIIVFGIIVFIHWWLFIVPDDLKNR